MTPFTMPIQTTTSHRMIHASQLVPYSMMEWCPVVLEPTSAFGRLEPTELKYKFANTRTILFVNVLKSFPPNENASIHIKQIVCSPMIPSKDTPFQNTECVSHASMRVLR